LVALDESTRMLMQDLSDVELASECSPRCVTDVPAFCGALSGQSKKIRGMETLVEKHQQLIKHMRLYEKFLRWAKK
jgi:hypothetical protein